MNENERLSRNERSVRITWNDRDIFNLEVSWSGAGLDCELEDLRNMLPTNEDD